MLCSDEGGAGMCCAVMKVGQGCAVLCCDEGGAGMCCAVMKVGPGCNSVSRVLGLAPC